MIVIASWLFIQQSVQANINETFIIHIARPYVGRIRWCASQGPVIWKSFYNMMSSWKRMEGHESSFRKIRCKLV